MCCSGRAKDTIVLLSGKNIEPGPIEGALERSPLIKHALLLGQDKRELGALLFPDEEGIAALPGDVAESDEGLAKLLEREVAKLNAGRPDYHPEDHIGHIQVKGRDAAVWGLPGCVAAGQEAHVALLGH
jgi:long-chain acyl-CoA synthetase